MSKLTLTVSLLLGGGAVAAAAMAATYMDDAPAETRLVMPTESVTPHIR